MKFIPSASDFLDRISHADWMDNGKGEPPPSAKSLSESRNQKIADKIEWQKKEQVAKIIQEIAENESLQDGCKKFTINTVEDTFVDGSQEFHPNYWNRRID